VKESHVSLETVVRGDGEDNKSPFGPREEKRREKHHYITNERKEGRKEGERHTRVNTKREGQKTTHTESAIMSREMNITKKFSRGSLFSSLKFPSKRHDTKSKRNSCLVSFLLFDEKREEQEEHEKGIAAVTLLLSDEVRRSPPSTSSSSRSWRWLLSRSLLFFLRDTVVVVDSSGVEVVVVVTFLKLRLIERLCRIVFFHPDGAVW
jgi:hypothetical protein